ncbi:hypothetical protein IGJ34_000484 [Enterococcus sp. AZ177]
MVIRTEGLVGENYVYIHENERVIKCPLAQSVLTISLEAR